jgi:hypothetical protein
VVMAGVAWGEQRMQLAGANLKQSAHESRWLTVWSYHLACLFARLAGGRKSRGILVTLFRHNSVPIAVCT